MRVEKVEFSADLESVLGELKSQLSMNGIDMLNVIRPTGYENVMISCPYHKGGKERRPSAGIKRSTGVFHCFTCGETHSLPEVISHCFGRRDSGTFGWDWLLRNFLSMEIGDRRDVELDFSRVRKSDYDLIHRVSSDMSIHDDKVLKGYVSEEELSEYRYTHPYLEKRGIVDDSIIELFDIGYDKKSRAITFPVRDIQGNCLFVARRSVNTKFFNYPSGVEKPLYGLYELQLSLMCHYYDGDWDLIICESMIDCILLWQAGHYAVALNGLGNRLQLRQLSELPCRHLILATDNDEAGHNARLRIMKCVNGKIFSEIEFPNDVKDIGDCTPDEIADIFDWEVYV